MPDAVPHRYHSSAEFWSVRGLCDRWLLLAGLTLSVDVRKPCRSTLRERRQARSMFDFRTDGTRLEPEVLEGCPKPCGEAAERVGMEDRPVRTVEPESLLSPHQLAAFLNVPVGTVYDWRHRGCGPPGFRLGKHVRYRRSDVEQWIDDQAKASIRVTR